MGGGGFGGRGGGELRLADGDVAERGGGVVLEGKLSVEDARAMGAKKAWGTGEGHGSVADYDPVLRAHCRLDKEG